MKSLDEWYEHLKRFDYTEARTAKVSSEEELSFVALHDVEDQTETVEPCPNHTNRPHIIESMPVAILNYPGKTAFRDAQSADQLANENRVEFVELNHPPSPLKSRSKAEKLTKETREELLARLLDPVISLDEAAQVLDVCPTTVRRYTNTGLLPHHRTVGNQRRFRLSDVLRLTTLANDPYQMKHIRTVSNEPIVNVPTRRKRAKQDETDQPSFF